MRLPSFNSKKLFGVYSPISVPDKRLAFSLSLAVTLQTLVAASFIQNAFGQQLTEPPSMESSSDRSWYFNGWSGPGFVLLKNGNVLHGDVITQGNGLIVKLDNTGEISVVSGDVVAVKSSLLELYEYQVSKTIRWEAGEHWHLAKWCLRFGLLDQAHDHYVKLKSMAGKHPSFKRMEAEIKAALLRDPVIKEALRELQAETQDTAISSVEQSKSEQTVNETTATTDIASTEVAPKQKSSWKPDTSHLILDRYTQEYFRQQVHPFIMLKCGQAGCHGGVNQNQFQITRSGSQRNRRTSDASLLSTIPFLVEPKFDDTILYSKATNPHGSRTAPPLDVNNPTDRELFDRLRYWHAALHRNSAQPTLANQMANNALPGYPNQISVPRIASANHYGTPTSPQSFSPPPLQGVNQMGNQQTNGVSPGKAGEMPGNPNLADDGKVVPDAGTGLLALEREIAKLEEIEKSRKSRDSHDPADFNRQFGPTP